MALHIYLSISALSETFELQAAETQLKFGCDGLIHEMDGG